MPTYEYKCTECGHCFDVVHGINENVEACEACGSRVRRLFHPVGVIFKGSGFYSTDNRASSSNGGKPSSASDANGSDKKAEEPGPPDPPKPAEKADKPKPAEQAEKPGPA